MKNQEMKLLISLYAYFAAALIIAVGQDNFYYRCKGVERSAFSCDAGRVIIVKSAIVGAADRTSDQCPITNSTCLNEITNAAELCTGRNSCDIKQNIFRTDEWKLSCPGNGNTVGNFMNVSYTCIFPDESNYGDICHFDEDLYSNSAVYISSYPKLPDAMGPEVNYSCSCMLTSKYSSSPANVIIRALLVKLTGRPIPPIFTACSERLSITDSGNETKLAFCSPCNNANNVTTVPLVSNPEILFRRDPVVSPNNGKFILEITVPSVSSESGSIGSIKCVVVGSTMSSSTTVTTTSPTYSSTTTTIRAILSTKVKNTSSEITTRSNYKSISQPTSDDTPTPAGQHASEKKSISTGGIIGIVLGSVALIVIIIIVLLCLLRKQKQNRDHSKGNTNFTVQQSVTVIQNMQTTDNIELHDATSSELHTFQSAAHFNNEPQTTSYETYCQPKDNSMSNYEALVPVSDATYRPGRIQPNEHRRLSDQIADDPTTETQSLHSGDGDITVVENQLYGENENSMTDVVASSDYAVVRPVVPDGRTDQSAEVDRVYAVVQMKNNSADLSYYNVPDHRGPTGSGTVQSPAEVIAEGETNITSDEIQGTNPMYKADSEVVLIDNTLYGSMLTF